MKLTLLLMAVGLARAQAPDCQILFTVTSAATTMSSSYDNRSSGCVNWTLRYQSTGFTMVSVELDSAASPLNTGLSFGAWAGTVVSGSSNPIVSNTGGEAYFNNGTATISWVRAAISVTGVGTLNGQFYGYRLGFASGAAAPGTGVTSVATGCGLAGGPVTTSGTISRSEAVNAQTMTTYAILTTDCGKLVTGTNAMAQAYSIAQAGSAGFAAGWFVDVENRGAGTLTITPTVSTIDGSATLALVTNQGVRLVSDGANYFTAGRGTGATTTSFSAITSGTNTTAAMVVGSGATMATTGTGDIASNDLESIAFASLGVPANGQTRYCTNCGVTSSIDDTCVGGSTGAFAVRIAGAWHCGGGGTGGGGTVTVVGGGNLTNTALVTGGGGATVQTPAPTATMDASGNISTPGSITATSGIKSGSGAPTCANGTGGVVCFKEGTAATAEAAADNCYGDSTLHGIKCAFNNGSFLNLPLETGTMTSGHLISVNATTNLIADAGVSLQGTDSKVLTSGTISGTAAALCTDANGGATTSGCSSGGSTLLDHVGLSTTTSLPTSTDTAVYSFSVPSIPAGKCIQTTVAFQHDGGADNLTAKEFFGATSTSNSSTATAVLRVQWRVCNRVGSQTAQDLYQTINDGSFFSANGIQTATPTETTSGAVVTKLTFNPGGSMGNTVKLISGDTELLQ